VGSVFLSSDNQWIGFVRPGLGTSGGLALKKVPISGGTPTTLASGFSTFNGASWGPRGVIAFSVDGGRDGIKLISETGGALQAATTSPGDDAHVQPHFLPDGERLLYTRLQPGQPPTIVAVNTRTGEQKDIIQGATPRYVESGHLVFGRELAVWAARFDLATLEIRGEPVRVLENAMPGRFGISKGGTLVYMPRSDV
jgi:hypothetical protein